MLELKDAVSGAKELLGCRLVHETAEGVCSGIIVETESYMHDDPASHSFKGQTARNQAVFGAAGHAYIYFTYGMHYCFNVVTGPAGLGQAVLIRALQPEAGIPLMKKRRGMSDISSLTNGPAKLVQALGITKADYGINLLSDSKLRLEEVIMPEKIISTTRIGISQAIEQPWRFYIAGNQFVSKP